MDFSYHIFNVHKVDLKEGDTKGMVGYWMKRKVPFWGFQEECNFQISDPVFYTTICSGFFLKPQNSLKKIMFMLGISLQTTLNPYRMGAWIHYNLKSYLKFCMPLQKITKRYSQISLPLHQTVANHIYYIKDSSQTPRNSFKINQPEPLSKIW